MGMKTVPVKYYRRGDPALRIEPVMSEGLMRWAYQDARSGFLHRLMFHSPLASRIVAAYFRSPLSRGKIQKTIEAFSLDVSEFREPVSSYTSFHDFFIRRLKPGARAHESSPASLAAPADARYLVFPKLEGDRLLPIKGSELTVHEILDRNAREYAGGTVMIARLCPGDYHRFHFPCGGEVHNSYTIKGHYESVNPIALATGKKVFSLNKREVTEIRSKYFGTFCFVEVGAFGVGSIVQTYTGKSVSKMREKGYFEFGGSTIMLFFEPGKVRCAGDLIANTEHGYETWVPAGETIATTNLQESFR